MLTQPLGLAPEPEEGLAPELDDDNVIYNLRGLQSRMLSLLDHLVRQALADCELRTDDAMDIVDRVNGRRFYLITEHTVETERRFWTRRKSVRESEMILRLTIEKHSDCLRIQATIAPELRQILQPIVEELDKTLAAELTTRNYGATHQKRLINIGEAKKQK